MIEEPIAWVVEIGIPIRAAPVITSAAPLSAANPWTGSRWVIRSPRVRTTHHPPIIVPSPITTAHERITQSGISKLSGTRRPDPASFRSTARVTMPIVFCASFVPWLKAMKAAETIWALPKTRATTARRMRPNSR